MSCTVRCDMCDHGSRIHCFFLKNKITPLRQRDPKQRFLSTSVGRSLIDDDEDEDDDDDDVDDDEAEWMRVRMMIKVLRL